MKIKTWQERCSYQNPLAETDKAKLEFAILEIAELRAEVERLTQKSIEDSWRGVPSWQQGGA